MRKNWMRWTPGILLVVSLFVAGCTDQKEGDSTISGAGRKCDTGPGSTVITHDTRRIQVSRGSQES